MDIELFRKLLLAGLILVLIVILYKRLLRFLTGKTSKRQYSSFLGEGVLRHGDGSFTIQINVPVEEEISLLVKDHKEETVLNLCSEITPAGDHSFDISTGQLQAGRYGCFLHSSHQKSARYFNVK